MKNAFKRIMAMLLVIAMVIGVMPSVFAADSVCGFKDVVTTDWFAPYVEYVVNHDPFLMNGVSATRFGPNETCTRAMSAVVLYRLADPVIPSVKPSTFTDLVADWYKNGIAWAQQTGIVKGATATTFEPDGLVTREQLVTMMWRFAGEPEVKEDYLKSFPDAGSISRYAKAAFNWAVSLGIINGSPVGSKTYLQPQGNATRAEFAKIISVFEEKTKPCDTHTWDEGTVTKAATCTEPGEKVLTCTRCGETKTETIPALGHNFVDGVCANNCGEKLGEDGEVVIFYTNDVHTYIDKSLSYDTIADLKKQTAAVADGVLLVDAGDHIQGTAYGGMDQGKNIIKLMNSAGYDLATLGNHEFDYGMDRTMEIIAEADFDYVSANFYHEKDGSRGDNVLPAYEILEAGGLKIAFVGITTPESFTKSTPKYFQDEAGNYIYGIAGAADGAKLYASVQAAIVAAKAENPDYIIALGHLGDDPASDPWNSEDVIANVTGLDAFIDGHSHSAVEGKEVKDKDGKTVVLTQTGNYFDAIGRMSIQDGKITTSLIKSFDGSDAATAAIKAEWMEKVDALLNEKIAESAIDFTINYENGSRAIRSSETNLGDLNADAYYWFVNENLDGGCDMAIMNGGGIRANAASGNWTYKTCKTINTFGNVVCCVELTGQQILDALEFGARFTTGDPENRKENGGFLQVAGCTYEVNTYVPNTVKVDDKNVWQEGPSDYRVTNVKIYNKETGAYEALDLAKTYRVAGTNYTLYDCGDGFNMFNGGKHILDSISEDYLAMAAYVSAFTDTDGNGYGNIASENSPLAGYDGYLMNYESKTGSGRIVLNTVAPAEPDADNYVLASSIKDGDKVVIYNPGHNRVIENANDNNWYLIAGEVSPVGNVFTNPAENIVWTVKVNDDGTYSFVNGDNAITAWLSGTYVELTNDATYAGGCTTWNVTASTTSANMFYISSTGISTDYGPGYLECFLKKGVEKICGYASTNPTDNDFGFQFYVLGATPTEPSEPTEPTEPTEPSTEPTEPAGGDAYTLATSLKAGDKVVVWHPASGTAMSDEDYADNAIYRAAVEIAPADGKIITDNAHIVWNVVEAEGGVTLTNAAGQKLSIGSKGLNLDNDHVVWEVLTAQTENCVYLKSTTAVGTSGDPKAIEYFKGDFSTFYLNANSTEADFALQLYVLSAEPVEPTEPTEPTAPSTEPTQPSTEPVTEPATGDAYTLATSLKAGDKVVVWHPASGTAMSDEDYPDNAIYRAAVEIAPVDGVITTDNAHIVWNVVEAEGGVTLTNAAGQKLSIGSKGLNLDNDHVIWEVLAAQTENCVYLKSTTAVGTSGDPKAIEYFKGDFSTFYLNANSTEADFALQLYVLSASEPVEPTEPTEPTVPSTEPTQPSTEPVTEPATGDAYTLATSLKAGDKVVVWHPASGTAMSDEDYPDNAAYRAAVEIAPADGKIITDNAHIVWNVVEAEGGVTLTNAAGQKLSIGSKGLNLDNDHVVWEVLAAQTENCVYLKSTTAVGTSGDSKAIEYFKGDFTTFYLNANSTEADFALQLYVLSAEPVEPTEPTEPTVPSTEPTEPSSEPTEPTQPSTEPAGGVELVATALEDIKETDTVVIVMHGAVTDKDYALLNTTTSSAKGLAAIFDGTYADTMGWKIVPVEGGFLICSANEELYLTVTATNNGVVTSFDPNVGHIWSIDAASGYLCATDSKSAVRYLGVYDNNGGKPVEVPNFRCYTNTTGNTKNQTLTFYVVKTA